MLTSPMSSNDRRTSLNAPPTKPTTLRTGGDSSSSTKLTADGENHEDVGNTLNPSSRGEPMKRASSSSPIHAPVRHISNGDTNTTEAPPTKRPNLRPLTYASEETPRPARAVVPATNKSVMAVDSTTPNRTESPPRAAPVHDDADWNGNVQALTMSLLRTVAAAHGSPPEVPLTATPTVRDEASIREDDALDSGADTSPHPRHRYPVDAVKPDSGRAPWKPSPPPPQQRHAPASQGGAVNQGASASRDSRNVTAPADPADPRFVAEAQRRELAERLRVENALQQEFIEELRLAVAALNKQAAQQQRRHARRKREVMKLYERLLEAQAGCEGYSSVQGGLYVRDVDLNEGNDEEDDDDGEEEHDKAARMQLHRSGGGEGDADDVVPFASHTREADAASVPPFCSSQPTPPGNRRDASPPTPWPVAATRPPSAGAGGDGQTTRPPSARHHGSPAAAAMTPATTTVRPASRRGQTSSPTTTTATPLSAPPPDVVVCDDGEKQLRPLQRATPTLANRASFLMQQKKLQAQRQQQQQREKKEKRAAAAPASPPTTCPSSPMEEGELIVKVSHPPVRTAFPSSPSPPASSTQPTANSPLAKHARTTTATKTAEPTKQPSPSPPQTSTSTETAGNTSTSTSTSNSSGIGGTDDIVVSLPRLLPRKPAAPSPASSSPASPPKPLAKPMTPAVFKAFAPPSLTTATSTPLSNASSSGAPPSVSHRRGSHSTNGLTPTASTANASSTASLASPSAPVSAAASSPAAAAVVSQPKATVTPGRVPAKPAAPRPTYAFVKQSAPKRPAPPA